MQRTKIFQALIDEEPMVIARSIHTIFSAANKKVFDGDEGAIRGEMLAHISVPCLPVIEIFFRGNAPDSLKLGFESLMENG